MPLLRTTFAAIGLLVNLFILKNIKRLGIVRSELRWRKLANTNGEGLGLGPDEAVR
jgi:hypothetical protein